MRYSVIVPVYNRPDEIDELLKSLTDLNYKSFEVIIVEDGSEQPCEHIIKKYKQTLDIRYYNKKNSGQGFSRNFGFERASGDYFVVFDSDCIIPPHYFDAVNAAIENEPIDAWGGPDRADASFSALQKAINYSMTSLFTTGGIRGNKKSLDSFTPRSFNMGISREVYQKTGGFIITRMGEDIEFSIRIRKAGFRLALIDDAFVYHKRRTSFKQFFDQLFFFGRARINIQRFHPEELKAVHLMPLLFTGGLVLGVSGIILSLPLLEKIFYLYIFFALVVFFDAFRLENRLKIALYAVVASFIQLTAYGLGFAKEFLMPANTRE